MRILISLLLILLKSLSFSSLSFSKENELMSASGFVNLYLGSREQSQPFEHKILPDSLTRNRVGSPNIYGLDSQIFIRNTLPFSDYKNSVNTKFETNFNGDGRNQKPSLDQIFFANEGELGKFEFGNNQAVNQKMKVGPARFSAGAGGINGKYIENIAMPMMRGNTSNLCNSSTNYSAICGNNLPKFILLAQSPIGHGGYAKGFYAKPFDNSYVNYNGSLSRDYSLSYSNYFRSIKDDSFDGVEDATKINYYSPRIKGLKFGISYAHNLSDIGFTTKYKEASMIDDKIGLHDVVSAGVNYQSEIDNLDYKISATAEKGITKNPNLNNLFAYDLGVELSYFGFDLGASYGNWGKSLQSKYESKISANYYTFGFGYAIGPIKASVTNIKSNFQNNIYNSTSIGLTYKIKKDFVSYLEFTNFRFSPYRLSDVGSAALIVSNRGLISLAGILFSF